jgi:signal transduction histidine kinase
MRGDPFSGRSRPKGEPRPGDSGPEMFGDPRLNELWEMEIQHRAGSLEAALTEARNRNLAISFSILLLLAGSVFSIVISTRRAHRLAQQQIEFVAAVTHELRTPLAVIHSAGQNLADGVIKGGEQTARYGALISKESRRLAGMIEQVLEFASEPSRREPLELKPQSVADLIDNALAATQPLIREGQFQVEKEIEADLPAVMANEPALRRALQNLLDNAMKYSGSSRWIAVRARKVQGRKGMEIEIGVEDHGIGIPPNEVVRIFEPFFRGKEVTTTSIHGNGLGLSLVKSIVTAHRGRIGVDSRMGRGTYISLHLPAAPEGKAGGKPSIETAD